MSKAPRPWRVGKRVPEHVYDAQGRPLMTMPTARLAALVVIAVNHYESASHLFNVYLGIEYRHVRGEGVLSREEDQLREDVEVWLGLRPVKRTCPGCAVALLPGQRHAAFCSAAKENPIPRRPPATPLPVMTRRKPGSQSGSVQKPLRPRKKRAKRGA